MIVKLTKSSPKPEIPKPEIPKPPNQLSNGETSKQSTQIKLPSIKINIAKSVVSQKESNKSMESDSQIRSVESDSQTRSVESDESKPNMVRENIGGIDVWFNPETQKFYDLEMSFLGHINHDRETIWK